MKLCSTLLLLILCAAQVRAATYGVTVPTQNTTLTNGMLPYATSGRQLASTAIQQSGLTNLLIPGYITMGNTTNRISDDGSNLTRNGVAIGGGGSGDVVGPASAFDNAIVRFDGVTGKLVQNSLATISDAGAFTFSPGVRQTFNPDANTPGFNVGSVAGDPSTPINGDLWYDSMLERLRAQINGSTVSLGSGGSGGDTLWNNVANTATLTNTMQSMTFFHDVAAGDDLDINFDMYAVMNSATFNDWGNIYMVVSTNNAQLNVLTTANNTDSGVRLISGDSLFEIRAEVDGTTGFRVLSPSGYTGAGTLFLSDDGTYKSAGGGGDTIWTNGITAGAIQPISTNDVALHIGNPAALAEYGSSSTNRSLLAAFYDEPTGDTLTKYVGVSVFSPGFAEFGDAFLIANGTGPGGGGGKLELISGNATTLWQSVVVSDSLADAMHLDMSIDGVYGVSLNPKIASTGSAVAHFVDTFNVLTNGDSLLQVRNQGVTRLDVTAAGAITGRLPVDYGFACSDETSALTTTTNAVRWRAPHAFTLTGVRASLTTTQSSGSIATFDLKKNGTSVLSTLVSIDNGETTSVTAATPPVISTTAFADDDIIVISITQVGTGGTGAKFTIKGYR